MKKNTQIVVKKVKQDESVNALISQALTANVSVETMEKLFALREKVKAEQAREAFTQALAGFQGECPIIEKTKVVMNKDGVTVRYKFAPIDSIIKQIKELLAKYGFSYTWNVVNKPDAIVAICKITHVLGHSEINEFEIPIGKSEFMTAPQQNAAALTFAKRYTLCNGLGISTGDEDTDATTVNKEKVAKSDKSKIMFLLRALKFNSVVKDEIAKKVKDLTSLDLEEKNYGGIVTRLEILIKEKEEYENTEVR